MEHKFSFKLLIQIGILSSNGHTKIHSTYVLPLLNKVKLKFYIIYHANSDFVFFKIRVKQFIIEYNLHNGIELILYFEVALNTRTDVI